MINVQDIVNFWRGDAPSARKTLDMTNYQSRPATKEDAQAITDVQNATSLQDIGVAENTVQDLLEEWEAPKFNLETDSRIWLTDAGQVVAYAELFNPYEEVTRLWGYGRVHPAYEGQGLGTAVTNWMETRAREFLPLAKPGVRVNISTGTYAKNETAHTLLANQGFVHVRNFYRMDIDLKGVIIPDPEWPEGVTLRPYQESDDLRPFYEAFNDSFSDHWGFLPVSFELFVHDFTKGHNYDPSMWYLAEAAGQIVAFCICFKAGEDDPGKAYVGDVGTIRAYRKRGLALALLRHAFQQFQGKGYEGGFLWVDASSLTGATRLYEKAGMHTTRESHRFEKELQAGVEKSTQSLA
jgi:mycothiol synthase